MVTGLFMGRERGSTSRLGQEKSICQSLARAILAIVQIEETPSVSCTSFHNVTSSNRGCTRKANTSSSRQEESTKPLLGKVVVNSGMEN